MTFVDPADLDDPQVDEATAPPGPLDDLVRFRFRRAEWIDQAACREVPTDVFYTERGETQDSALAICDGCPVRTDCLEHALELNEKYGVWGGSSERQRRRMRASRRRGNQ